jgi:hypothetical protein
MDCLNIFRQHTGAAVELSCLTLPHPKGVYGGARYQMQQNLVKSFIIVQFYNR